MNDPLGRSPEQRRAAEERLVARYEAQLMRTMEIPIDRRSGPREYDPIWPLADGRIRTTEAFQGIFVEEVRIERAYPDTVMVIVVRFFLRPECLYSIPGCRKARCTRTNPGRRARSGASLPLQTTDAVVAPVRSHGRNPARGGQRQPFRR